VKTVRSLSAPPPPPQSFHLIGHDHGAVLGWTVAASDAGAARLASYVTSISVYV